MPTQLHLYSNGSFIDPQLMPTDQVSQRHRLRGIARHHVHTGKEMPAAVEHAQRLLTFNGWSVNDGELATFYGQYYQAAANPGIAQTLANDSYLTNYFHRRSSLLPTYRRHYGEWMIDKTVPTLSHIPSGFLHHLYPTPPIIRIAAKAQHLVGSFWDGGELYEAGYRENRFLPLPVTGRLYPVENMTFGSFVCPEAITSWPFIVASLPPQDICGLTDLIVTGEIPVISIITTEFLKSEVIFQTDATNYQSWHREATSIRRQLEQLGLKATGMRYDWLAHTPSLYDHLIYLA